MRRGFAACISATFVVGIMGENDRVGIVRAVGADGSPVIDGNVGRPVIVGKRGTDVKKEYAADVMLDVIVACVDVPAETPIERERFWRLIGSRVYEVDVVIKSRILKPEMRVRHTELHPVELESRHKIYDINYPQLDFITGK